VALWTLLKTLAVEGGIGSLAEATALVNNVRPKTENKILPRRSFMML
jgi:hypothetical protein